MFTGPWGVVAVALVGDDEQAGPVAPRSERAAQQP
jgi:hypothetical protein